MSLREKPIRVRMKKALAATSAFLLCKNLLSIYPVREKRNQTTSNKLLQQHYVREPIHVRITSFHARGFFIIPTYYVMWLLFNTYTGAFAQMGGVGRGNIFFNKSPLNVNQALTASTHNDNSLIFSSTRRLIVAF